ncbi:MAG: U32 family peptidase [Lachnospiraceae bacterium]|nr:U32 family peptidase [Lachnospiraceae bacterium]
MTELLAPAGSLEALRAAVNAGADAVYIGGRMFGARAYADNPDESELIEGIEYCHLRDRKVYLTVNTLLKEQELQELLIPFLTPLYQHGVDALIVQDLGVLRFVRKYFPDLPLHASTQMSITTPEGAALLARHGVSRVVPARELSLREVQAIVDTGIEVETFVHGAICYCYSGRCLLSSMLGGRSGNRGRCAQPCRLPYAVEQQSGYNERRNSKRKKESGYMRSDTTLLSMKDMCSLDFLPDLIDAGIASFKIEGRMKRPEYAAGVTAVYRKYMDLYVRDGRQGYQVEEADRQTLLDLFDRGGFSRGYYQMSNGPSMIAAKRPKEQDAQTAQLKNERNQRFLQESSKVKINGDLRIYPGSPVILEVWLSGSERGGEYCVKAFGEIPQEARTNAASKEDVMRQMRKTGGTDFEFEQLHIELADGLFLPVRMLNELRRDALASLKEKILKERCVRSPVACPDELRLVNHLKDTASNIFTEPALNILITLPEQLEALICWLDEPETVASVKIDTIYMDSMLFETGESLEDSCAILKEQMSGIQGRGIHCFLCLPPVLRESGRRFLQHPCVWDLMRFADGVLVQTMDELAFLKQRSFKGIIASEDCLYSFNSNAKELLCAEGITRYTLPAELNRQELTYLNASGGELIIYGYQPLMQSAQCVRKNTSGCISGAGKYHSDILYLRDRKHIRFPVLTRCRFCTNTIFNSVPLQLFGCRDEIRRIHPDFVRISFTIESSRETELILKHYRSRIPEGEGTRGHFKRGVE